MRAPLAGCRILIAEDEWFLANDLQTVLKSVGADVVALVGDLDDAQAQVARGEFDLGIIEHKPARATCIWPCRRITTARQTLHIFHWLWCRNNPGAVR